MTLRSIVIPLQLGRGARVRAACLLLLMAASLVSLATAVGRADVAAPPAAPAQSDSAAVQFFETSIRPLLAERCFQCHGPEKHKGDLRLDSPSGMMHGGESGVVVVPGHPEQSLLVKAIGYQDPDLQMPPKKKLSDRQIADLTRWVQQGAPWPQQGGGRVTAQTTPVAASAHAEEAAVTAADKAWWAFQPIRRPAPPDFGLRRAQSSRELSRAAVKHADRVSNPIDAFVLSNLEAKGLEPNPLADRRTLIRRAYFDLIGLPPSPEEVEAFVRDESPSAYESLLDRLLARPEYGQRWARYWLDLVRYAQTNGYERDGEKPFAWRYRDYVIKAFNEDKPYDRFILEQLAGDELDDVTDDSITATGFYHLGVHDDEPDDARAAEYEALDDVVRTTSTAFLGLTVGCARCHDHKFDPIPQADYYRLLAFFDNVRSYKAGFGPDAAAYTPIGNKSRIAQWRAELERKAKAATSKNATATEQKRPGDLAFALSVHERGPTPRKTNVLVRGNPASPGAEVQPAFLSVLGGGTPAERKSSNPQTTGLRRALAEWIVRPDHPLTARVMVNRVWQYHFGKGIVPTPDDFGKTGLPPTNPELLDYLAGQFVDSGWSVKRLHKLIMLSSAYRMSSRADNEAAARLDPANDLLWRQNLRRLDAEALRDAVLAVSGRLNPEAGGRGFFPKPSREVIAGGSRPGDGWDVSSPHECDRRSIYAYVKRSMLVPILDTFDYNNTAMPSGTRSVTTVATQALMLLNDDFLQDQSAAFADRLAREAGPDRDRQLDRAYQLALGRAPTDRDRQVVSAYLDRQQQRLAAIQSRLTFRPDVPGSLAASYLNKLHPEDFLTGPRGGWVYGRGRWGKPYEGILVLLDPRADSPYALNTAVRFADGTLRGRMMLKDGVELAGLIVRGNATGGATADTHSGYDFLFDPKAQVVTLQRHGKGAGDVATLATAPADLAPDRWYDLKVETSGPRLRLWIDGRQDPVIDATDPQPLTEPGSPGVRAWGAAVAVEAMAANFEGQEVQVLDGPPDPDRPARQAMQSLCLLLYNLNEFVYVD